MFGQTCRVPGGPYRLDPPIFVDIQMNPDDIKPVQRSSACSARVALKNNREYARMHSVWVFAMKLLVCSRKNLVPRLANPSLRRAHA